MTMGKSEGKCAEDNERSARQSGIMVRRTSSIRSDQQYMSNILKSVQIGFSLTTAICGILSLTSAHPFTLHLDPRYLNYFNLQLLPIYRDGFC